MPYSPVICTSSRLGRNQGSPILRLLGHGVSIRTFKLQRQQWVRSSEIPFPGARDTLAEAIYAFKRASNP